MIWRSVPLPDMLLFSVNIQEDLRFAAWKIEEGEAFFRDDLPLSAQEEAEIARHQNELRRLEWLAGRWLLHRLTGRDERLILGKSPYSKPFFLSEPQLHCSLSHSQGTVATLLSNRICGCDIQVLVEKMPRIAPKFMRPDELAWVSQYPAPVQLEYMHLFWTAKEAMYKAHGLKELDFRGHLFLEPFVWQKEGVVQTTGRIQKDDLVLQYQLFMGYFENENTPFVWTLAQQSSD